jgi:hypothetical protein
MNPSAIAIPEPDHRTVSARYFYFPGAARDQRMLLPVPPPPRPTIPPARLQHLARHLHTLGPRSVLEALKAILAGAPPDDTLEGFARLDPTITHAIGADRLPELRVLS